MLREDEIRGYVRDGLGLADGLVGRKEVFSYSVKATLLHL